MNFETALEKKITLVNEALDKYLPFEDTYPKEIHEAMRYSVFSGGKRLRPILTMAVAELVDKNYFEKTKYAACALECIHTYSLIHDDLPAMDNDDFRRGKLTCHKKFGEALAILAGDSLLTLAFELLTKGEAPLEARLKVVEEIAVAVGSLGLIGGQVVDMSLDKKMDEATLKYIHQNKTGTLIQASVRAGAILAGIKGERLSKLTTYAKILGLVFQIVDDILDIIGDEKKLGKPLHSDEKNNKITYPALYGLKQAKEMALLGKEEALKSLEDFGQEAWFLRQLICFVVDRDY